MVECEVALCSGIAKSMTDESSLDVRPFVSVHEHARCFPQDMLIVCRWGLFSFKLAYRLSNQVFPLGDRPVVGVDGDPFFRGVVCV